MNPRALLHRTSVASHRARAGRGSLLDHSATSSAIDPAGARSGRQGAAPRRAVVACGAPGARSGAAGRALTTLARSVVQNECPITAAAGQLRWYSRVDAGRATPRAPSRAHRRLRGASRRPLPATRLLRPAARSPRQSRACAQCHPARKTRQEQRRGGARRLLRGDARGRRPRPAAEGLASLGRQKAAQGLRMSLLHLKVRLRRRRVRVRAADVHAPSPPMLPQRALQPLTTRWCSQRLWTRGAAAGCTLSLRTLASPMRVSAMSTPARGVCGCRCTWMRRLQQPPRARSLLVVRPS